MSTALLLAIATASIVILLLLVIKARVHPFVALLIVSLLVAIATGIPAEKIMETIITGMGGLLGAVARGAEGNAIGPSGGKREVGAQVGATDARPGGGGGGRPFFLLFFWGAPGTWFPGGPPTM